MSLIVTALLVGGGAALAGLTARVLSRRRAKPPPPAPEPEPVKRTPLADAGFEIEQGDVISVSGRELWLEQGWLLREAGDPVAAILFAREAVVIALPKPRARLYWLDETDLPMPADPPTALDHAGVRYDRARRLPVEIEPLEKSPDPPWQSALLTEYRGLGSEVVWALVRAGKCRAWRGRAVDAAELENWGGGRGTLEG